ncbi:TPA: transposase [Salmonella enterica subsp. enterica serovar Hvittingfoss]|nr:transposase [Salmonella enterica subsp. enterica serovar Hvittingfoss]
MAKKRALILPGNNQVNNLAKSDEITAIPELLKHLTLSGCLVTMDAIPGRDDGTGRAEVEAGCDISGGQVV